MNIILLRHGESVDDILDCYGGAADYDLSDAGFQTAREVAEKLASEKLDAIYSSPFKRAMQTAQSVKEKQNCDILIASKLYERNSYGVFSAVNKDECKKIYGYLLKDMVGKVGDYYSEELVLGAEPIPDFDTRVKEGLLWVVEDAMKKGFEKIAVVTHGNVTRSIYKNILGIKGKVDLELLALTYLEYKNNEFILEKYDGITIK